MLQQLQLIYNAFERIRMATGNSKLPIIVEACKTSEVLSALGYLLNPSCTFGFAEKSLNKPIACSPSFRFSSLLDLCEHFDGHSNAKDEDIASVQYFLSQIEDSTLRQFAVSYLCKTYKIGITAKTLNKALGYDFIPLLECMLANKFFDHPDAIVGETFAITEKLDGIRCIAVVRMDCKPKLFSRQGQLITGLEEIENDLMMLSDYLGSDFVFDGELLVSNRSAIPSKEQYKRTTQIVRTKDEHKTGITYNVFDMLSVEAFYGKYCDTPYYLRRQKLDSLCECCNAHDHVVPLPVLYVGDDKNMILQCLDQQRQQEHEGVMINILDATYSFGRTSNLLKVKVMQDADLQIIGYEEGSGRFSGTLGALIVDYKGTPVGVGSGLSDEDRKFFWNNQSQCLGRVVTIQFFEETHDKNGKPSLRFPVYKELREEGKEVSYS